MRYLSSRANVVGSLAALATLGLHVGLVAAGTSGLGFLWPVAVAGVYGIGAVLGRRRRADLHVGYGEVEITQLRKDLDALRTQIRKYGGRLPGDVQRLSRDIVGTLGTILDRGDAIAGQPEALHVLGATIRDYVPSSLEAYLNLPRTFAMQRRVEGRRTAHETLVANLTTMQTEVGRIADAVFQGEARSLENQSRFLQQKFGRSALDLESGSAPRPGRAPARRPASELDLSRPMPPREAEAEGPGGRPGPG